MSSSESTFPDNLKDFGYAFNEGKYEKKQNSAKSRWRKYQHKYCIMTVNVAEWLACLKANH